MVLKELRSKLHKGLHETIPCAVGPSLLKSELLSTVVVVNAALHRNGQTGIWGGPGWHNISASMNVCFHQFARSDLYSYASCLFPSFLFFSCVTDYWWWQAVYTANPIWVVHVVSSNCQSFCIRIGIFYVRKVTQRLISSTFPVFKVNLFSFGVFLLCCSRLPSQRGRPVSCLDRLFSSPLWSDSYFKTEYLSQDEGFKWSLFRWKMKECL